MMRSASWNSWGASGVASNVIENDEYLNAES